MDILMRLGEFRFSVDTAAYQSLTRNLEISWPTQPRLWSAPAVQFTGIGDETVSLEGVVVPGFRGGLQQLNDLRALAMSPMNGTADPMPLVTGYGEYLGDFVILKVEEKQETITMKGAPAVQRFKLDLKRYTREVYS